MAPSALSRQDVEDRLRSAGEGSADLARTCLQGVDLSRLSLSKASLAGADLTDANLAETDLSEANLSGANLRGAVMFGAKLEGADFIGADLRDANLAGCNASRAGFGAARLEQASLFEAQLAGASFSQANLSGADLRCANLTSARLHQTTLCEVDASHADLRDCELDDSVVTAAIFDGCDLRGARLSKLREFERASWLDVDVRETDFRGAYVLRRLITDENYLHEFRSRDRKAEALYQLWRVTSDCGRNFWLWAGWTGLVMLLFAGAFRLVDIDYGDYPTALSPFYYSVVTLTTLGYGDVLPKSVPAQILVILEVCIGYVALGGLISILANKIARRGE